MIKSTQITVFVEKRTKGTLCVLLRGDPSLLPMWGMGGDINNIRFFLIWVEFPSLFHRESLWVGKCMEVIPSDPCSPISLAPCRCKCENFTCASLPKGRGFTGYTWLYRTTFCLPQRKINLTVKATFSAKATSSLYGLKQTKSIREVHTLELLI